MTDASNIGPLAMEVMERAEQLGGEVGVVAVIAEVGMPPTEEYPLGYTEVIYRCSDMRKWIQAGLFTQARRSVYYGEPAPGEDADE